MRPSTTFPGAQGLPVASTLLLAALAAAIPTLADIPVGYKGTPYLGTPWPIPGRIDFENYDLGGLNIAWKSDDKAGQGVAPGSTAANRANDGEKEHPAFWITNSNVGEVDKFADGSLYPSAENPKSIYIGAAHATDYNNTTVNVAKAGTYWISAHFASEPNQIKCHLSFNGINKTPGLTLAGTSSYHAWRYYKNMAKVELEAGVQVMQFMLDANHLNWDYVYLAADSNGIPAGLPTLVAQRALPGRAPAIRIIPESRGSAASAGVSFGLPGGAFWIDASGRKSPALSITAQTPKP